MKFKAAGAPDIIDAFKRIDEDLRRRSKNLKVLILGGASVLLLGLRERTTIDIDVAVTDDSAEFQKLCARMKIPVDIITIATTVDLAHCETVNVFRGKALAVDSVTPRDLLKLKLERFYKQDPEDIYAIIDHESVSFDEFKAIVADMIGYYIGNVRQLIISAQIVVEQIYPDRIEEFKREICPR